MNPYIQELMDKFIHINNKFSLKKTMLSIYYLWMGCKAPAPPLMTTTARSFHLSALSCHLFAGFLIPYYFIDFVD